MQHLILRYSNLEGAEADGKAGPGHRVQAPNWVRLEGSGAVAAAAAPAAPMHFSPHSERDREYILLVVGDGRPLVKYGPEEPELPWELTPGRPVSVEGQWVVQVPLRLRDGWPDWRAARVLARYRSWQPLMLQTSANGRLIAHSDGLSLTVHRVRPDAFESGCGGAAAAEGGERWHPSPLSVAGALLGHAECGRVVLCTAATADDGGSASDAEGALQNAVLSCSLLFFAFTLHTVLYLLHCSPTFFNLYL